MLNSSYSQTNSFSTFNNISTNSPFDQREIDQSKTDYLANDKTNYFNSNIILENNKNDLGYKSFLSKIKLYYYLKNPKKREQTITLNTSLHRSRCSSFLNQNIDKQDCHSIDSNGNHSYNQQKIILVDKSENGGNNTLVGNKISFEENSKDYQNEIGNTFNKENINRDANKKIEVYEQIKNYTNSKKKKPFNENRFLPNDVYTNYKFQNIDIKNKYDNNSIYENGDISHNIRIDYNINKETGSKEINRNDNLDYTNNYNFNFTNNNLYNNKQLNDDTNQNSKGNTTGHFNIHGNEYNKEGSVKTNSNNNIVIDLNKRNTSNDPFISNNEIYNDLNKNIISNSPTYNKDNQLTDNNKKIISNIFNNYQPTSENSFKDKIFISGNPFEENYPRKQTSDTTSDISNNLTYNLQKNNLEVDNQTENKRSYFDLNKIKFAKDNLDNSQKNHEIIENPYIDNNNVYEFEENHKIINKEDEITKNDDKKNRFLENQEIFNKNFTQSQNQKRFTVDQKNYNNQIINDDAIKLNVNDKKNYEVKNNSDKKKSTNKEFSYNNYSIYNNSKKNLNSLNELSNPFKPQHKEILVNRIDEVRDKETINNKVNRALDNYNIIKDNKKTGNSPKNIFINNIINQQDNNKNENDNINTNEVDIDSNNNNGIIVKESENEEEIEYEDEELQNINKNSILNNDVNYDNNNSNNNQIENKILKNENQGLFVDKDNNDLNNNLILLNNHNFDDNIPQKIEENKILFNDNQLSIVDNNNNNKDKTLQQNSNNNLIVYENQQKKDLLIKKPNEINNKKTPSNERYLAALLYGILFGSTSVGVYCLCNKTQRHYLYEKIKNININSIINFFKQLLHPITFFKSIFNSDKLEVYKRAFALSLIQIFDFLEQYGDGFRILGTFIFIYGFWLIFKAMLKTAVKIWKYYTK